MNLAAYIHPAFQIATLSLGLVVLANGLRVRRSRRGGARPRDGARRPPAHAARAVVRSIVYGGLRSGSGGHALCPGRPPLRDGAQLFRHPGPGAVLDDGLAGPKAEEKPQEQ